MLRLRKMLASTYAARLNVICEDLRWRDGVCPVQYLPPHKAEIPYLA